MATTLFLVRHAAHELVGRVLCGRMPGVALGPAGRGQAAALAQRLAAEGLSAIYTSPVTRAVETAEAISAATGLGAMTAEALEEIDFGSWTGLDFQQLEMDPQWHRWNNRRGVERPPGGESMQEVQRRMLTWMECLPEKHPDAALAAVSHADTIKAALAGLLAMPLDSHWRFEISPAAISTVVLWPGGARVSCINAPLFA